jgi:hypothetical protein
MGFDHKKEKMDIEGYNRGVVSLLEKLRVYAHTNLGVELTLNREQALLLADDLERGIAARKDTTND